MSDNSAAFHGERLKSARYFNKMSISDLAKRVNISKQAISQYETNKNKPKINVLINLSSVLGFPSEYFYNQYKKPVISGQLFFLDEDEVTNRERLALTERIQLFAAVFNTISEYIEFPPLCLYELKKNNRLKADSIAQNLRNIWRLGNQPILNLIDVLERNGIVVAEFSDESIGHSLSQFLVVDDKKMAVIVLNEKESNPFKRNFNLAYLLGYLMLDLITDFKGLEKTALNEKFIKRFAGALLVPEETYRIDIMMSSKVDLDLYIQLQKKYCIPAYELIARARYLNFITQNQYQYLIRQLSQRRKFSREYDCGNIPVVNPRYLKEAMKMLVEEGEVDNFINLLEQNGMILTCDMIENILNLPKGYLSLSTEKMAEVRLRKKG